jgi:3-isopropylmalate dehydrogenase
VSQKVLILPGDYIGPEIVSQARRVLERIMDLHSLDLELQEGLLGGAALDACGVPLPDETLAAAREADAILLGAVGGPKWDAVDRSLRPD